MLGTIFLDLIIGLGCAILVGLICVVFAITWYVIKLIGQTAKELQNKRTQADMSIGDRYTYSLETSDDAKKS